MLPRAYPPPPRSNMRHRAKPPVSSTKNANRDSANTHSCPRTQLWRGPARS